MAAIAAHPMNTCLCGNPVDQEGASCERCAALRILGLDSNATYREIEKTYRVLVKVWHPDRFQSDARLKEEANEKLKSINAAYAFLHSAPESKPRRRQPKKPAPPDVGLQPIAPPRRAFFEATILSAILLRGLIVLVGLAIPAIMLFGLDSWLSSSPTTAGFYNPYRSQLLSALRTNATSARHSLAQSLHHFIPASAASNPVPSSATQPDPPAVTTPPSIVVPPPHVPMPYVTVGLTADEVATVMGAPISSTNEALHYRNATFYLHNGKVAGWKVDPSLIPLRVKLWPSGHPDPRVTAFTIGSSKNDVVAVQGTPTMLSENTFAYGASEVFFDGGRVIGWNDNHASERLRIQRQ